MLNGIVITGAGLACAAGLSPQQARENIERGFVTRNGLPPAFELTGLRAPKNQKFLTAGGRLLLWSGLRALEQSGWTPNSVAPERIAVFVGAGQTGLDPHLVFPGFAASATPDGEPGWAPLGGPVARTMDVYFPLRTLSNSPLALLAMEIGARGPSNNYVQSSSAGMNALQAAADSLQSNECDLALCGAWDDLTAAADILNYRRAGITEVLGMAAAVVVLQRSSSGSMPAPLSPSIFTPATGQIGAATSVVGRVLASASV
ncbi:MAG: hypothetical protein FJW30_27845 [Acidobacteria bacterium]|nr:hypothetical protein [Acidobacteriota bacterium]